MRVKEKLLDQISKIENEELMSTLSSMLSNLNEHGVFELQNELTLQLQERSQKILEGEYISHEEVIARFKK